MNSINAKGLVVVIATVSIAVYLVERIKQPSLDQHVHNTRHSACVQIGAFNHSGVEPYDPFSLCAGEQAQYARRRP